jgi:excisionase family DNA binding protein
MGNTDWGNDLKTPREVAEKLNIQTRTLQDWRSNARGPKFVRVGRHIRYRKSDIEAWIEQQSENVAS